MYKTLFRDRKSTWYSTSSSQLISRRDMAALTQNLALSCVYSLGFSVCLMDPYCLGCMNTYIFKIYFHAWLQRLLLCCMFSSVIFLIFYCYFYDSLSHLYTVDAKRAFCCFFNSNIAIEFHSYDQENSNHSSS